MRALRIVARKKPRSRTPPSGPSKRGASLTRGKAVNMHLRAATAQEGFPGAAAMVIETPFQKGSVLEDGRVSMMCVGFSNEVTL
jgi:hypothetical protein